MLKRRQFLQAFTGLLAASGASVAARDAAAEALDIRQVAFSGGLSKAKFEALRDQTFYLHTPTQGSLIVLLVDVKGRNSVTRPEQFSVFFQANALPELTAGSYEVEHYLAGRIALYLEPVPGAVYRADFNLL